jgi:hypothetical protein
MLMYGQPSPHRLAIDLWPQEHQSNVRDHSVAGTAKAADEDHERHVWREPTPHDLRRYLNNLATLAATKFHDEASLGDVSKEKWHEREHSMNNLAFTTIASFV